MASITWASLSPIVVTVMTVQYSDLLMHLLAYGSTTFWFLQIFRESRARLFVVVCMIGYGMLMEAAQGFLTETRDANILDIIANTAGVFCGTFASKLFAPQGLFYLLESYLQRSRG